MLLMRRGGRAPHLIASSAAADSDLLSLVHPRDTYPSTWSAAKLDREALRSRTASTQLSGISSRSVIVGKSWESELHSADGDLTCSTLLTIDAHRPFDTSPIVTLVTTLPPHHPHLSHVPQMTHLFTLTQHRLSIRQHSGSKHYLRGDRCLRQRGVRLADHRNGYREKGVEGHGGGVLEAL